jgi:hypothetical protein
MRRYRRRPDNRFVDRHGYVQVRVDDGRPARKNGYAQEHRIVMSAALGRPLEKFESVHHRNGNRADNRIENLELWATLHPSGQRVEDLVVFAKEILARYG